jgi:hypothetical protein
MRRAVATGLSSEVGQLERAKHPVAVPVDVHMADRRHPTNRGSLVPQSQSPRGAIHDLDSATPLAQLGDDAAISEVVRRPEIDLIHPSPLAVPLGPWQTATVCAANSTGSASAN